MKNLIRNILRESVKLPIKVGDTVYMGRFKNKKTVIKDIEWNEKGDLMINGRPALKFRIPEKKKLREGDFDWVDSVEEEEMSILDLGPNKKFKIISATDKSLKELEGLFIDDWWDMTFTTDHEPYQCMDGIHNNVSDPRECDGGASEINDVYIIAIDGVGGETGEWVYAHNIFVKALD